MLVGYYYFVSLGTTQGATGWTIQTAPTLLGTDPVVFAQFSASTTYTAGTGISLVGNVFANTGVLSNTGTANEISVSSPNGANVISLPASLTLTGKTITGGTYVSGAFNGTLGSTTPTTGSVTRLTVTGNAPTNADVFLNNSGGASDEKLWSLRNNTSAFSINLFNDAANLANPAYTIARTGYQATQHTFYTGASVQSASITSTGINQTAIGQTTPAAITGTVFSSSSNANIRTSKNNFHVIINVKDYGAVGDGSTDDTAAIAAAFAAAVSGSTIYFPQAQVRYNCTGCAVPASLTNVLIKGDQAQIYQPTNANNQLIIPATCSYVTVDGIWFNGVGSSRANGIHIRTGADYTTIRNCRIEMSSDWGIQVDSAGAAVKGFVCENNYFVNTLGDGVHVMNVDGFRIENNTFWLCGDDAIAALAQSTTIRPLNGVISNNYIYGRTTAIAGANTDGQRGIVVFIGKNILISGNHIWNTASPAIEIADEYNSSLYNEEITVIGNTATGCNVTIGSLGSIQAYFCSRSSFKGNHVVNPATGSGFAFADCSVMDVSDNSISQSLNQFCRGIVNNNDASYQGRTITASNDVMLCDNEFWLSQASNDSAIYLPFTTGARCNNLIVAGNKARSTALSYINTDWVIVGKFVNNVTIGGTTAPATGGNSTSITSTNNT